MGWTYEQKKNISFITGHLIVGLLVLLSGPSVLSYEKSILLGSLVIFVGVIPSIFDFLRDRSLQINKEKIIKKMVKNIQLFLSTIEIQTPLLLKDFSLLLLPYLLQKNLQIPHPKFYNFLFLKVPLWSNLQFFESHHHDHLQL